MAYNLKFDAADLGKNLISVSDKFDAAVYMFASTKASELQATMKKNRLWTDRTGMAKASLSAKVSQPNKNMVRITLAHGVDYGIWLELANEMNYAIIKPTIHQAWPIIRNDLKDLLGKLKL